MTVDWDWTRVVFDHVKIGVRDAEASKKIYRTVLATLDIPPLWEGGHGGQYANLVVSSNAEPGGPIHIAFVARSREELDAFSLESYKRAQNASKTGLFTDEIAPGSAYAVEVTSISASARPVLPTKPRGLTPTMVTGTLLNCTTLPIAPTPPSCTARPMATSTGQGCSTRSDGARPTSRSTSSRRSSR